MSMKFGTMVKVMVRTSLNMVWSTKAKCSDTKGTGPERKFEKKKI